MDITEKNVKKISPILCEKPWRFGKRLCSLRFHNVSKNIFTIICKSNLFCIFHFSGLKNSSNIESKYLFHLKAYSHIDTFRTSCLSAFKRMKRKLPFQSWFNGAKDIVFLFLNNSVNRVSPSYNSFLSCKELFRNCIFVVKLGNAKIFAITMTELEKLRARSCPCRYCIHIRF